MMRNNLRCLVLFAIAAGAAALLKTPQSSPQLRLGIPQGQAPEKLSGLLSRRTTTTSTSSPDASERLRGGFSLAMSKNQGAGSPVELLICVGGIYFCYLYYGVLQEALLTSKYGAEQKTFQEVCSLLFLQGIQCFIGAVFARIACMTAPQPATGWQSLSEWNGFQKTLWPMYMQVGFCYVLAMFFSNSALFYINYPTQVIVKSCKMIPVMAVSVLWRKKQYPMAAYVRVAMVTAGIIMFTFFKEAAKKTRKTAQLQVFGLGLAMLSLFMDGFVGPAQEEIFSQYKPTTHQMMYYVNGWAFVLLLLGLAVTGDGVRALAFVGKHPAIMSKMMQFGLMSAMGQFFIFWLVRSFSALTLVTVTTTRKFFTVLASIFWFQHKVAPGQWFSIALVFTGLGWEETNKYIQKQRARAAKAAENHETAAKAAAPAEAAEAVGEAGQGEAAPEGEGAPAGAEEAGQEAGEEPAGGAAEDGEAALKEEGEQ